MSSIFSAIKSKVSILDIVSYYATLKRVGGYWKCRCPFHHEKTASFTVSPHREIFYCFGCHAGGDAIAFIAKVERCTPLEAAKLIADRYNIEIADDIRAHAGADQQTEKEHFYRLYTLMTRWFHQNLAAYPEALKYVTSRGFTKTSIDRYAIGYFPGGQAGIKKCLQVAQKEHFLPQDLVQHNLLAQGKSALYSPLEERIIFPINDHLGRTCGFGGRIFEPHDQRPKYYNSRESEWFVKGSMLFGFDVARTAIQKLGTVFLVEGYTDCIAMAQYGFENTVATLGTACTVQHLRLLGRFAHTIYVLYDADQAGQQAVLRLTQWCWQANVELQVVCLPAKTDPASFLTAGGNMHELVEKAQDIFSFFISFSGTDFQQQPLSHKVTTAHKLLEIIAGVEDPLKQELLITQASQKLLLSIDTLRRAIDRLGEKQSSQDIQHGQANTGDLKELPTDPEDIDDPMIKMSTALIASLAHDTSLLTHEQYALLIDYLPEPFCAILAIMQGMLDRQTDSIDYRGQLFDSLTEEHRTYVARLVCEQDKPLDKELFQRLVMQLLRHIWKDIARSVQKRLANAQQMHNETEAQKIVQQFRELKRIFSTDGIV